MRKRRRRRKMVAAERYLFTDTRRRFMRNTQQLA
jgi:hypothetical protein